MNIYHRHRYPQPLADLHASAMVLTCCAVQEVQLGIKPTTVHEIDEAGRQLAEVERLVQAAGQESPGGEGTGANTGEEP